MFVLPIAGGMLKFVGGRGLQKEWQIVRDSLNSAVGKSRHRACLHAGCDRMLIMAFRCLRKPLPQAHWLQWLANFTEP